MALTDNIVAAWNFNESSGNAADSSGNGWTLTNNNTVGYVAGLIGNAADFGANPSNKYLSAASGLGVTMGAGGAYSVMFWVKLKSEPGIGTQFRFLDWRSTTGNDGYLFPDYRNASGTLRFNWAISGSSDITYNVALGSTNWHQIIVTADAANAALLYLDGTQIMSTTKGTFSANDNFFFGITRELDSAQSANCLLDMGAVWSRAITSSEVTQLYNGGAGLQYPFPTFTPGPMMHIMQMAGGIV